MGTRLPAEVSAAHPKPLDSVRPVMAKADCKALADWRRVIGERIERALILANLSKQEASFLMGYADQSTLSRWIAGVERAQMDRLFAIPQLRVPLVVAFAELAEGVQVSTTITIRQVA